MGGWGIGRNAILAGMAACLLAVFFSITSIRSEEFTLDTVAELARARSAAPFVDPAGATRPELRDLPLEQWEKIRYSPNHLLWSDESLPFSIGFYHPGYMYHGATRFNLVDADGSRPFNFSSGLFEYPTQEVKESANAAGPGFAGFFLRFTPEAGVAAGEQNDPVIASFLGASYFQSRGRHSRYGVYARGLAVDTALPNGEEFPYFSDFWLVKPAEGDTSFSMYALMESSRLTGAFHFVVAPGTSGVMTVQARFFLREGQKAPAKLGLAPLTSMFLFSESTGAAPGDYRPEVHNSDGLLLAMGEKDWLWRPLHNPQRLTVNRFPAENLKGYGLLQRDDQFDHYQDLNARFDRRSSLWVEPGEGWGSGHVELVEIPGNEDYHGNIVAFWVPSPLTDRSPPPAASTPFAAVSYTLHWMTPGVSPHDLGRVTATRMRKNPADGTMTFFIDFEGEQLNAFSADTGLASVVTHPEQFSIVEKLLVKNEVTLGWRLILKVKLPQNGLLDSLFSSREGAEGARFTALLKPGENLPEALTETWVFDLQP